MQITSKEIYSEVSEESNISLDDIKFVGDIVFREWSLKLKDPQAIILKIKKLGRQYLRRNRLIEETKRLRNLLVHCEEDIETEQAFYTNEERKATVEIYSKRLNDYSKYVSKKKEVQEKRYPKQPIIPKLERDDLD